MYLLDYPFDMGDYTSERIASVTARVSAGLFVCWPACLPSLHGQACFAGREVL